MAITIDQLSLGTASNTGASASQVLNTTAVAAAGSIIVLHTGQFVAGISLSSVAGGGLTWSVAKQGHAASPAGVNPALAWALAPAGLASATAITLTFSGSANVNTVGSASFLGVDQVSPIGATAGPIGVSPAAAAWTTGNVVIADGSALIGMSWQETTASTNTPGSLELGEVAPAGFGHVASYRIEPTGGSFAVTGTWSNLVQDTTIAMELKAAAATSSGTLYQSYGPRRTKDNSGPFNFFEARRQPVTVAAPAVTTVKRLPATGVG